MDTAKLVNSKYWQHKLHNTSHNNSNQLILISYTQLYVFQTAWQEINNVSDSQSNNLATTECNAEQN